MKNWLEQMKYRMANAMQGSNGMDTLAKWSLGLAIVLIVVSFFLNNYILNYIALIPMAYSIFRCYSKNVYKRQQEDEWFCAKVEGPTKWFKLQYKKIKNRKTTKYFTCSNCHAVYSLPKGKGKLRATCPKCHQIHEHTT